MVNFVASMSIDIFTDILLSDVNITLAFIIIISIFKTVLVTNSTYIIYVRRTPQQKIKS